MGVSENNGDRKYEVRVLLRYYWKQISKAAAAAKKCDVEGESVMNERTAQQWFKRLANGNLSLEDEQRPGRPRIWDSEAAKEAAEQQPSTSTRRLSDTIRPSKSTIHRHLTALEKIYKSCRFVPHELTVEQAQRRVEFCRKLLQLPKDHRFIKRFATYDENCIYLNNPDLQKQWLDKGQLPVPLAKRERFEKKVPFCVWWNYEGLIYYELVSDSRMINVEVYTQQLEKMYMVLLEKYTALVNAKRVLLQQDNSRPTRRRKLFRKSKNWKVLNCYRIPFLVLILSHQTSICFVLWPSSFVVNVISVADVEVAVEEYSVSKDKVWFYQAFKELSEKWVKTFEHENLYFEY
jgi:histone-lysine N-methyltransferase SETMAR